MKKKTQASCNRPLPLLMIEWLDAGVITHGDWITKEEALKEADPSRFINHTVGWLLREDAEGLVVAAQCATGEEPRYDLVMFIPKSLIRKRKMLKP